jgi:hypothetical protein
MPSNTANGQALSLRGWAAEAEAAASIAKALAPTSFIPDHLKVWLNPDAPPSRRELDYDSTVAQVAAVLLAGQELELKPMASLRAFVIIRGTVALYAIAARGLLQHQGHDITVVESTSVRAVVRGRRAGTDDWQTSTWDLDRAKTAQLYPGKPDGNWRKSPKAMLVARATAEASRWVAADALLGLPPIVEEVEDAEVELVPVAAIEGPAAPAAAVPEQRSARRRNPPKRAALPSAAPGLPPPEPPAPPVPEDAPAGPKPTKAQLTKLHAMLGKLQITGREEGLGLISAWAGRLVTSTNSLSPAEIEIVFERMGALLTIAAQEPAGEEDQSDQAADAPDRPPDDQPPDEPPAEP